MFEFLTFDSPLESKLYIKSDEQQTSKSVLTCDVGIGKVILFEINPQAIQVIDALTPTNVSLFLCS